VLAPHAGGSDADSGPIPTKPTVLAEIGAIAGANAIGPGQFRKHQQAVVTTELAIVCPGQAGAGQAAFGVEGT
jgi:hypothetical protein